jgi:hypothetical protein
MILLLQESLDKYKRFVASGQYRSTRVHVAMKADPQSHHVYEQFKVQADHYFMLGYIIALQAVPCAGNITVVSMNGVSRVTGAVSFWSKAAGVAVDELEDILLGASKNFCRNHPKASSFISATLEPTDTFAVPQASQPPSRR